MESTDGATITSFSGAVTINSLWAGGGPAPSMLCYWYALSHKWYNTYTNICYISCRALVKNEITLVILSMGIGLEP